MPNTPNGVRRGSSRRSDHKRDQEPGSPNSNDLSRRNTEESQKSIAVLASSGEALQRLANIAQYFVSLTSDMQVVEDDYGAEIDKENEIRKLSDTVASLTFVKSEEMETLQHENKELLAEREACRQEKEKCQETRKNLEAQNARAEASRQEESNQRLQEEKAKLLKQFKKTKAELEEGINKKLLEVKDKHAKLSATNVDLKQRCLEAEERLETKKTRHARVEKSLEDENKKLTEDLKQLQAQFPVERQPMEHYAQQFRQISDAIRAVSSKYFQILPEQAMENPEAVRLELCKLSPIFRATPIWSSPVSEFLRMRNVEHIISSCLCDSIWPSFLPQDSLPTHQGVSQFLEAVSSSLSASGGQSESVWRVLTLRGISALNLQSTPESQRIESTVQRILTTLQPLIPPSESAELKKDLISIVANSATLWAAARKDEARIIMMTQPEANDKENWQAEDLSTLVSSPSIPPSGEENLDTLNPPLCLFPHILYTNNTTQHGSVSETVTLHQGHALFPTSRVCIEGLLEKKKHKEELAKAVLDAQFQFHKRRVSMGPNSPTGGKFAMAQG